MQIRTRQEIKMWENSPNFIKKKETYQAEKEELQAYIKKYTGKRADLEKACQLHTKTQQYTIGAANMQRGALCPSKIFDVVIGNVKRGRLVKKITKQQPSYIYFFNGEGRLLKAEQVRKKDSQYDYLVEYILYEGDCEIGITYRLGEIIGEELAYVTRVIRKNGKLISYEWGKDINEKKNIMRKLYSEKYFYDEDNLVKVDMVELFSGHLKHNRYFIKINEQGQALSYTSNEIIGEKVFEDDYEREIKKKVFFFDDALQPNSKSNDGQQENGKIDKNELERVGTDTKKRENNLKVLNTDIINCLSHRIQTIMESWNEEEEIYAISFFLQDGEEGEIPYLAISYNTEEYCGKAAENDEERWNYACWSQNEENVIEEKEEKLLREWYKNQGIPAEELGFEDSSDNYDDNGTYIGKGPKGMYELVQILVDVARKLKEEKVVEHCCKKDVPIIIHDLEYTWYMVEATKRANPGVDLSGFLEIIGY